MKGLDFPAAMSCVLPAMGFAAAFLLAIAVCAATRDLGQGFFDHGVATPISNHRGMVATVDGEGRNVLLAWLTDHRGGYSLLMIDAQTGKAEQFAMPFGPPGQLVDSPYASLLSSGNKFYTQIKNHLVEFDPVKRAFTFCSPETTPWFAMGMTEDDNGVIWSVTYPQSGVVSFDPKTRAFRDYGEVYKQDWQQYQRFVAADDAGWIYFGLGMTASQIVALDPVSGKAKPILAESERKKGSAYLYRDMDGKVYAQALKGEEADWYALYKGEAQKIGKHDSIHAKPIITGDQSLAHLVFPDGTKITACNFVERQLVVRDAGSKQEKTLPFDYDSDGATIMGVIAASDGTICGGTTFPMRFFSFNARTDAWVRHPAYGQWNALNRLGDHVFVAGYPGGFLLDWDASRPWIDTDVKNAGANPQDTNPQYLVNADPEIHRPACVLPLADGKTVIFGGTPQYGYTGGGLLFWNREDRTHTLLKDSDLTPDQSTRCMVALDNAKLLGATTTSPGTGGQKKAKEAELYVMDLKSRQIEWHAAVFPDVQDYTDLLALPGGLVYGVADQKLFFVFDPVKRVVVHQESIGKDYGLSVSQQGARVFVSGPGGEIYLLCANGIERVEPGTHALKQFVASPQTIEGGGDYCDGRIFFINGAHLLSYKLK